MCKSNHKSMNIACKILDSIQDVSSKLGLESGREAQQIATLVRLAKGVLQGKCCLCGSDGFITDDNGNHKCAACANNEANKES